MKILKSNNSVDVSVEKLIAAMKAKGLTIFCNIDHQQNARNAGLQLNASQVIIFGNPNLGTHIINAAAQAALDLPQKILVHQDNQEDVWLSYEDPKEFQLKHSIIGCDELIDKVSGVLNVLVNEAATV
jgi:uncharacterized protein (DUF302 family)